MGYRNITVDGVEYKYVIGRTFVKVKGFKARTREEVGHLEAWDPPCECCGEPMSSIRPEHFPYMKLMVTPADIAEFIQKETRRVALA